MLLWINRSTAPAASNANSPSNIGTAEAVWGLISFQGFASSRVIAQVLCGQRTLAWVKFCRQTTRQSPLDASRQEGFCRSSCHFWLLTKEVYSVRSLDDACPLVLTFCATRKIGNLQSRTRAASADKFDARCCLHLTESLCTLMRYASCYQTQYATQCSMITVLGKMEKSSGTCLQLWLCLPIGTIEFA